MSTLALPLASTEMNAEARPLWFAGVVGFFLVFRVCLIFLFFQSNPVTGTMVTFGLELALLFGAIFYTTEDHPPAIRTSLLASPVRWLFSFLMLSLASILWTGAESRIVALGYWVGMAADIAIVLLLVRHGDASRYAEGLMKGTVWGAALLALVAWWAPVTQDLRLGNDAFLHPNTLGLELGISTLIAQHLVPRGARWKWLAIALSITLLRTLSKTAIIAFIVAECWYLMQDKQITRKAKTWLGVGALLVVASFWSVLNSYVDAYSNAAGGNQVETLTGRTVLWAVAFSMSLERPWFGHGIYSFRALIPAFGDFQPVHAHNELLQQFFEFGLVGVIVVAGTYWSLYRQARRAQASELKPLSLALLIFALVHGLTDTTNFGLSFPLWLLTALSICLAQSSTSEVHKL